MRLSLGWCVFILICLAFSISHIAEAQNPVVTSITNDSGTTINSAVPSTLVKVHGRGFGVTQGSNYIGFCTAAGSCYTSSSGTIALVLPSNGVTPWSDNEIDMYVPPAYEVPYGTYLITVFLWDGRIADRVSAQSNGYSFTTFAPGPSISGLSGGASGGPSAYQALPGAEINIRGFGFSDFTGCAPGGTVILEGQHGISSKNFRYIYQQGNPSSGIEELALGLPSLIAPGTYSFYLMDRSSRRSNSVSLTIGSGGGYPATKIENGPQITNINPSPAWLQPTEEILIYGGGFGETRGQGVVKFTRFPGHDAPTLLTQNVAWANNQINFEPPSSLSTGTYHVSVVGDPAMACGKTSNSVTLTIKAQQPVWGFADLHSHPASNFAFGGDSNGANGIFWGSFGGSLNNYGTVSTDNSYSAAYDHALAADLPACSTDSHDGFDADPLRHGTRTVIIGKLDALVTCIKAGCSATPHHGSSGAPSFAWYPFQWWPAAASIEHQQMHVTAIRRAYEGGLRLIFASVTDDQPLSDLWNIGYNINRNPIPVPDPNFDLHSAQTQFAAIGRLVAANSDWMQIVTTSAEARQAIYNHKLAVILSLEMDSLRSDQILSLVANNQVRHVIPIHLVNNYFGGTAVYSDTFNGENNWFNGSFYSVGSNKCLTFSLGVPEVFAQAEAAGGNCIAGLGECGAIVLQSISNSQFASLGYPSGGQANAVGLLGTESMLQLMSAHVLLDIVHMGEMSADQTLRMAEARKYPLMDSHTPLRDDTPPCNPSPDCPGGVCLLHDLRNFGISERALPFSAAKRIGALGGVIGLGTSGLTNNPDPVGKWLNDFQAALNLISEGNGGTKRGVALGTDMNGLSPQIAFDIMATNYPITVAAATSPPTGESTPALPAQIRNGSQNYDFQTDGIANYGMLPDLIQAVSQRAGSSQAINALYSSAEDVIEMWEAAEKAFVITPAELPAGVVGSPYSVTLVASGGVPPYTWTFQAGSLPPGLAFGSSGTIVGTPAQTGSFLFQVMAHDSAPQPATDTQPFGINSILPSFYPCPAGQAQMLCGDNPPKELCVQQGGRCPTCPPGQTLEGGGCVKGNPK